MVDKIPAKLVADKIIPVIPYNPPDSEVSFMVEIENAKEIEEERKKNLKLKRKNIEQFKQNSDDRRNKTN